ncbi:hypothetical protein CIRG_10052 [Coccidioides immitis RMSCC 2394]|uniref:rRNA biogenesis protein RRP36 n=1 Tax=Coccidioides immitis RMSCC 2394 TaxID=404692 RepID=A0A0J6Y5C5_COCIT|nr:hypothetical protein CIRG_10052 [Coccidioides immitis RMSCC 2394]
MALLDSLNRRIKARVDDDDPEEYSDLSSSEQDGSDADSDKLEGSEAASDGGSDDEELSDSSAPEDTAIDASLNQISFGALAKAQASLGLSSSSSSNNRRKRKLSTDKEQGPSPLDDIRARIRATREEKSKSTASTTTSKDKKDLPHRSSKHAPTVQSSKHTVSRKRTVVDATAISGPKARDPRFDSVVLSHGTSNPQALGNAQAAAAKNYSFLNDYRDAELSSLKQQLAKAKNPAEKEQLKRTIRSMTDKIRTFERKQREKEVAARHRRRERDLIREGKKSTPYFLKKGDVKKEVLKQRYEEMGAKERQKSIVRRRKKVAARERREMPDMRRTG